MTRILPALALAALSVSCVHAQTKGVLKTISTNALTEDLVIPAGKTITNLGTAVGFGGAWGTITGTLASQTDLATALDAKQPLNAALTAISALNTQAFGRSLLETANAAAARTLFGLGGLATLSTVGSSEITDGSIVNADINASAAIDISKISGLQTALDGKWSKASTVIGTTGDLVAGVTYIVRGNATYTRNLPASPNDGDTITLVQSGDTWTGTVTLGRNGSQINGASSDVNFGAPAGFYGGVVVITYHSASGGWKTHGLPNASDLGNLYAAIAHTHNINNITGTNTNRLWGAGGTFAAGQEITISSPLSLSAGALSLANGDRGDITVSSGGTTWSIDSGAVTNAMLAGSIDPTKITGTSAILGANTFTTGQVINVAAGFSGNSLDFQKNGSSVAYIRHDGFLVSNVGIGTNVIYSTGGGAVAYISANIGSQTSGIQVVGNVGIRNNAASWLQGTSSPEGAETAPPGSIYSRNNSGSGEIWWKATGTGDTGWTKLTP